MRLGSQDEFEKSELFWKSIGVAGAVALGGMALPATLRIRPLVPVTFRSPLLLTMIVLTLIWPGPARLMCTLFDNVRLPKVIVLPLPGVSVRLLAAPVHCG